MVFENDDDFGIDVYRSDIWDSVASKNKITVGLIKFNDKKAETLQGDFLGVQSNVYSEEVFDIEVNLNSYSPQALKLKKQGFEARGDLFFKCYAKYDVDISSKDMIVFFDEYTYGINAGYVFRVEMQDTGLYQGQYCWKEFDIILVRTDGWEYKSQANTIALNAVKASYDDLDEDDYTIETWEVMAAAYALPERTNPEVLAKIEAMDEAIDALVFHDLEALEDLLDSLDLLTEADYTAETWSDLEVALALSQTTNPLILAKIAAIEIAVSALVFAGQEALDEAKDAAALLVEGEWTAETWAVLVAALALPETSNSEVVSKTSAINDAISGLQLKQVFGWDSFEDGNYTTSPVWTITGTGSVTVDSASKRSGEYGLSVSGIVNMSVDIDNSNGQTREIEFWFKGKTGNIGKIIPRYYLNGTPTNLGYIYLNGNGVRSYFYNGQSTAQFYTNFIEGEWYSVRIYVTPYTSTDVAGYPLILGMIITDSNKNVLFANSTSPYMSPVTIPSEIENLYLQGFTDLQMDDVYYGKCDNYIGLFDDFHYFLRWSSSSSSEANTYNGVEFIPVVNTNLISIYKDSSSTATTAVITTGTRDNIIATATFVGNTATLSTPLPLTSGVTYYACAGNNGSSFTNFKYKAPYTLRRQFNITYTGNGYVNGVLTTDVANISGLRTSTL
jgi:hypothetical protein